MIAGVANSYFGDGRNICKQQQFPQLINENKSITVTLQNSRAT